MSAGRATMTVVYVLTLGRNSIMATYLGSNGYLGSVSRPFNHTVHI